ncbi:Uncharacterised protein [Yersinia rohdei]|uniref:hypothetical protein n=1 Tax=Yersinia rohdei TaxID=29485 RepID=UPI00061BCF99|nr:hypothetical protein [Yersinia rohdei]CNF27412.1 Uncharacterised protein [Yersinia rohdei]
MQNEIRCPVCGLSFNPKIPLMHIQQHHKDAKDCELAKIRDARRKCFTEPTTKKLGSKTCLPEVARFAAGHRTNRKEATHIIK